MDEPRLKINIHGGGVAPNAARATVSPSEARYEPAAFVDYFGRDHSKWIIRYGANDYFVKTAASPDERQKDVLACKLVSQLMNVPAVIVPDSHLRSQIDRALQKSHPPKDLETCELHLVRVCQDHPVSALPIQNLTEAIAAEIVFSTWINRRDAHNSNRVYVSGIPMFFDFGAAFETNRARASSQFFKNGPDSGYVPNWRLWKIPKGTTIDTRAIRDRERGRPLTLHPIEDLETFWKKVGHYCDTINKFEESFIESSSKLSIASPRSAKKLASILIREKSRLSDKIEIVRNILES